MVSAAVDVRVSPSFCGSGVISSSDTETYIKKAYASACADNGKSSALLNVCGIVLDALVKSTLLVSEIFFTDFGKSSPNSVLVTGFCDSLKCSFRLGFIRSHRLRLT